MANAAKYGSIQPSEFERMEWFEAIELSNRVTKMHFDELEQVQNMETDRVKAMIKAIYETARARG